MSSGPKFHKGNYWAREGRDEPWAILHYDGEQWWCMGWDVPLRDDEVAQLTDVIEVIGPDETARQRQSILPKGSTQV